jgi:TolA-binding protein
MRPADSSAGRFVSVWPETKGSITLRAMERPPAALLDGRAAIVLAACSMSLSGCFLWTSADQGADLQRRTEALEATAAAFEETRAQLRTDMETASTRLEEMETATAHATQVITESSADTGAHVEELQQQLANQEGAIDELRHEFEALQTEFAEQQRDYEARMEKLSRRAGVDVPLGESAIPAGADENFTAAQTAYEARDFSTARALYRAFVTRHHDDARADDAQYFIGQSYLLEDRPATALGELRRVISDFASGDRVPYALLAMADSFYRLHACTDARTALDAIIRGHARSPVIGDARARLRDVTHAPAGYCAEAH